MKFSHMVFGAASLLACFGVPAHSAGLPNGASSLKETYDDWQMVCRAVKKDKTEEVSCALSQALTKKGARNVVFRIRLVPDRKGGATGQMVVPLGVSLKEGATLQIDDGALTAPNAYSTCLRPGCFVPVDWPDKTIAGIKSGGVLNVNATGLNGQKFLFEVSLKGVSAAFERASGLMFN